MTKAPHLDYRGISARVPSGWTAGDVAACAAAYETSPAILLGCIIVSGTRETEKVFKTEIHLAHSLQVSADERAAYDAFRRVWGSPTEVERAAVMDWAWTIAAVSQRTASPVLLWGGQLISPPVSTGGRSDK